MVKRVGSKGKDVASLYETGRRWLENVGYPFSRMVKREGTP
jgi:hypothetical protein